ncbi:MAG: CDP-glycerol glycerophosphotransferase family protein [Microbacteriaceae bacterium]
MNAAPRKSVSPVIVAGIRAVLGLFQVLYSIARLIPAPDRIVFLSRQANQATPDILALQTELTERHGASNIVVLARKMNSDRDLFYGLHLLRQVWHIAHARRIILDSYSFLTSNLRLRAGTSVIQMWHAIGSLKRFGWDDLPANNPRRRQLADALRMHAGNTTVIASSERAAVNFASAFKTDRSRVVVSPLPRVDLILGGADNDSGATPREWFDVAHSQQVLLVAPTLHSELEDPDNGLLDRITELGEARDWLVWRSFHPVSNPIRQAYSTAELLADANAFLTDKSSMIYEAGLRGIPGFLWAPPPEQAALFAESYPTEAELRPLIVESAEELFEALADPARRAAATEFAKNYVDVDSPRSATERLAAIIASS